MIKLLFLSLIGSLMALLLILLRRNNSGRISSSFFYWAWLLVLLRFAALGNHSYLHAFFTHRALCSTVFALLASLRLTTLKNRKKRIAR